MISTRMKQAVAAGLIGVTALTSVAVLPNIAEAQTDQAPIEQTQEERQANRAERRAMRQTRRAERSALITGVLGVSAEDLQAARQDGQSLADIATSQGVAVQDVIDAIVENKTTRIQDRVAAGDMTQTEADERIAGLEEKVTEKVNAAPGERRTRG